MDPITEDSRAGSTPTVGARVAETCFHRIFERQARRRPDDDAVVGDTRRLSYRQVEEAANRLAHRLRREGVGPEVLVGLAVDRTPDLVVALLAILKAGGAYLPLDPSYPPRRLEYMVRDAGIRLLVTGGEAGRSLPTDGLPSGVHRLDLAAEGSALAEEPSEPPPVDPDPAHLAYVIYTSGSTGKPKGVQLSHRGLAHLAAAQARHFAVGPDSRVLLFAPVSFDASVFEMLMAFHAGAALHLSPREELIPGQGFADLLAERRITHLTIPPSALAALPGGTDLPDLRVLVCAGEALPPALVGRWAPGRRMFNAYGPTEATVWTTVAACRDDGARPPIGHPIGGVEVVLLDPEGRPREAGGGTTGEGEAQEGELAIGGPGLARGYRGRPGRTATAFVPDPRGLEPGARLYRTGDRARRNPEGELEFLGRIDHQAKVRGFRVEPGEVQAALEDLPQVRTAFVAVEGEGDAARLVAWAVPEEGTSPRPEGLLDELRESLPAHLLPAGIVLLDRLPVTPNGKVDREALPPLEGSGATAGEAPRGPGEKAVARIWCELLGIDSVGRSESFFALGGHSLLVGQMISRLRQTFGVEIPLARVFAEPTVAALAEFIHGRRAAGMNVPMPPPVRRAPRDRPLPLSFPQERVWFLNELAPGNVAYNSQATIRFRGPFRPEVFRRVLCQVVRKHEAFRTRYPAVDGKPMQEVLPPMDVPLPVVDLAGLPEARREAEAETLVAREVTHPFDVLQPPLARWRVLRLAPDDQVVLQMEHHFVHDGWSFGVLMNEIRSLYPILAAGGSPPDEEPAMQVADFAAWQRDWLQGEVLEDFLDFWTDQVAGSEPALDLPTDRPRPRQQSFRGACVRVELAPELGRALRSTARREGWTLFTLMMATFAAQLHRYSHQNDFLVGTAAANRRLREMEEMIGMAVNTLVLRADLTGDGLTFRGLAERVHRRALAAWGYQEVPLDRLVERIAPDRDLSRNPLFQVMFSFHDSPVPDLRMGDVRGRIRERHNGSAKADLNVVAIPRAEQQVGRFRKEDGETEERITLLWEYATDLFDAATAQRMVEHFKTLLAAAAADPDRQLWELPLLGPAERRQIAAWSRNPAETRDEGRDEAGLPVHRLVARRAATAPDAPALAGPAGVAGPRGLSYGELEVLARRLARHLRAAGVGTGVGKQDRVAVCLPASPLQAAALLAVLRTGAAYLPLDPAHPRERLAYILEDAGNPLLLTTSDRAAPDRAGRLPQAGRLLDVETAAGEEPGGPVEGSGEPVPPDDPDRLAYVIYTSGSTGRPKGTELTHRGLSNLVAWHRQAFAVRPEDRATLVASPSFDASVWELWPYLAAGASLHVPDPETRRDPPRLLRWLAAEGITLSFLPTALAEETWRHPAPADLALRALLVGGDRLHRTPPGLPYPVYNQYGPTEATVVTTWTETGPGAVAPPIGRPIRSLRTHVVDPHGGLAPVGVTGELWIGGPALARGYLERPALTADRFRPDPFSSEPGERLYRTGDRVRWRAGGDLEFRGRTDHQVQVRGFRIEPAEIEALLEEETGVARAAVLPDAGGQSLVAFVVPAEGREGIDGESLRRHVARHLPEAVVPTAWVSRPELPMTPHGKVDRRALAAEAEEHLERRGARVGGRAPRTPVEQLVAGIWETVLELPEVGAEEDFFALGGHSLLATRVRSRLRESLGVEPPLSVLFEETTVAKLASALEELRRRERIDDEPLRPRPDGAPAPLSFAQERLWFLDRLVPDLTAYNIVRAWRLGGALDVAALAQALHRLRQRHRVLRTRFPEVDGEPEQRVEPLPRRPEPPPRVDLSALPPERAAAEARERIEAEADRPFDLESGPPLRPVLFRLAGEDHVLLLALHHVVADGWSLAPLLRDLGAFHDGATGRDRGAAERLPDLPVQYADFAAWQRRRLDEATLERLLAYWREALEGAPRALALPTDRPRPALQSFRGGHARIRLDAAASRALAATARRLGATPFLLLSTAWALHLHRLSGRADLVFGTPVAGRERRELEELVGLFVNTVALRSRLGREDRFVDLLSRARETLLDAHAHQDLPFEHLVDALVPARDLSRSPLYQVLFAMEAGRGASLELAGLESAPFPVERRTSHFDLTLFATSGDGGTELVLAYDSALFDRITAQRFVRQLRTLTAAAVADPEARALELPWLEAGERHQLLREWNDTATGGRGEELLHGGFEEQAQRRPDAPAVVWSGGETLTYGDLEGRANRLARHLRRQGVGRGSLVGIHLRRSPRLVVAVLAVCKAGGAYVPLEDDWPAERVRWILAEHDVRTLLVERATESTLGDLPDLPPLTAVVTFDGEMEPPLVERLEEAGTALSSTADADGLPSQPPAIDVEGGDRAYVIFTSGSTGRPKGVVVHHRSAVNLVEWVNRSFSVGPGDLLLFVTNLAFDLSVYDVFGILAAGATVRLATREEAHDPQRLVEILVEEPITFWDSAPTALQQCVPYFPPPATEDTDLRLVFLSGDWIPVRLPDRVRRAFTRARVVALGGATEATIWSNHHRVRKVDLDAPSIPYGRPIDNARYHVLDGSLHPLPIGVEGDLYIGGDCVTEGYSANPQQTARQYRPDPFSREPGGRLYATGDRARYFADGKLEFLGRRDTQVKVRGYRIELGEIEAVLRRLPEVAEAVVVAREDEPGDQRLVAYLELAEERLRPDPAALREYAGNRLPEYMVPSHWVEVERWPRSSTGKLDRDALPPPERAAGRLGPAGPRHGAPAPAAETGEAAAPAAAAAALEARVARLWREVLGVETVERNQSFFDLGGHSLLMTRVHRRLQDLLGRKIPMVHLFRHPTVASLAASLVAEGMTPETEPASVAAGAGPDPAGVARGPVAIVGLAGRFPGAADVEALWEMLLAGREGIRRFTDDELLAAGVDPDRLADPRYVRARGALEGADRFDAPLFAMTPREAQITDPQQRLLLECAWQALEDAGYDPSRFDGRIGVFGGVSANRYQRYVEEDRELMEVVGPFQVALANHPDYVATRVAYTLDLTGPALTVQTACSTSLVAVHLAARSLLAGECDLALAGGASVHAPEVKGYLHFEGGVDSPDGHTRTFDAEAAGVVNGSGVGVVVLKRLEDAVADGDTVRAVIRGSALNNDGGHKVGFTAPSEEGQARAVRQALASAGVEPGEIGYVEAHGTGTPLGDPIEVAGLRRAFGDVGGGGGGIALGSIKTNIGHLDAAAGVAGLIKAALAVERGKVPPSLHFRTPNPELGLDQGPFFVADRPLDWPRDDGPRRAGVSSFGIGGTNVHAVLEEPPPAPEPREAPRPSQLLVLSAAHPGALDAAAVRLADHLERRPPEGPGLADVAWTLQVGRRPLPHRRAVVCRDPGEAVERLREAEGFRGAAGEALDPPPPVAFLFPGQGSQYPGMGEELYNTEPVFREVVDRAVEVLRPELGLDLREVLFPLDGDGAEGGDAGGRLEATGLAQPALFTFGVALARLWESWGVKPVALLGHSLGELSAACVAGVFSLDDGLRLVAARGRLMAEQPAGSMLGVALDEEALAPHLERLPSLSLAAANAPAACVVSGPTADVEELAAVLAAAEVETRPLHTSHAFHSAAMDPVVGAFAREVGAVPRSAPRIPLISTVTGAPLTAEQATDPDYWGRQARLPVRFAAALDRLLEDGPHAVVEVGPGRTLATFCRQHPRREALAAVAASLPHPRQDLLPLDVLLTSLGRLWCRGVEVDWPALAREGRRRVPLPTYPFVRRPYSVDSLAPAFAVGAADAATAEPGERGGGTATTGKAAPDGVSDHAPLPFPDGRAPALPRRDAAPRTDTEEAVAAIWKAMLGVEGISPGDDFFDLGGSSLMGVQMAVRLGDRFGVELRGDYLLEASTLSELAALVDAEAAAREAGRETGASRPPASCLVRLQRAAGSRAPLFLVHQVGGHVYTFRPLVRELGKDQPLHALRSRGIEAGEEPFRTIGEMAAHYLDLVRQEQPTGPYFLGGASMGGMVAFEMARRLTGDGEEVAFLGLMDTPCGDQMPPREDAADAVVAVVAQRTGVHLDADGLRAAAGERPEDLDALFDLALERLAKEQAAENGSPGDGWDPEEARRMARVLAHNAAALYAHQPEPWEDGELTFFRARDRRPGDPPRPELPWIDLAPHGTRVLVVPGDHLSMHQPPQVETLGAHLRRLLDPLQD